MSDLRDSLVQSGTLIGYLNTIVYAHNYNDLSNKPQINGVTLQGDVTPSELGLVTPATEAVQSVNGETGNVVLDGNDIYYDSNNTVNEQIDAVAASINYPVTSVNEKTGAVVLNGMDIDYDSSYTINQKIDAVAADIPVVPVQSVNGETGDVVLDGDDIAYNSSLSVNQKIDAVESSIPVVDYPVTSVAGKTGVVELYASDIMIQDTASGAVASFDTSLVKPLVDCTTEAGATKVIKTSGNADIAACIRGLFLGTHKFVKLGDLSSSGWNYDSTNLRFYHSVSDCKANTPQRAYTNGCVLSNSYEPAFTTGEVIYATMITEIADMDNIFWLYTFQNGNQSIQFKDTDYTTIESFVNSVKDVYWIYELETPVTPTITQAEFETLCTAFNIQGLITDLPLTDNPTTYTGINNFFADSGDISVTYLETIKEYIDKVVAP